jgi:hypothetical protein
VHATLAAKATTPNPAAVEKEIKAAAIADWPDVASAIH